MQNLPTRESRLTGRQRTRLGQRLMRIIEGEMIVVHGRFELGIPVGGQASLQKLMGNLDLD